MAHKRKKALRSLIAGHLGGIKRALLEGEKRPTFLEFLEGELHAKAVGQTSLRVYLAFLRHG
jgi:hypothetical protein